jgi:hypothetical protein
MLLYGTVQSNEAQLTFTLRTKVTPGGLLFSAEKCAATPFYFSLLASVWNV